MTKRKCYQCGDDDRTLDEIREARNAKIRAWGRKVLEDADAALKGEREATAVEASDWDLVSAQEETPEQEVVEVPEADVERDALAQTTSQETETRSDDTDTVEDEPIKEDQTEKPAAKKASTRKGAPSKD